MNLSFCVIPDSALELKTKWPLGKSHQNLRYVTSVLPREGEQSTPTLILIKVTSATVWASDETWKQILADPYLLAEQRHKFYQLRLFNKVIHRSCSVGKHSVHAISLFLEAWGIVKYRRRWLQVLTSPFPLQRTFGAKQSFAAQIKLRFERDLRALCVAKSCAVMFTFTFRLEKWLFLRINVWHYFEETKNISYYFPCGHIKLRQRNKCARYSAIKRLAYNETEIYLRYEMKRFFCFFSFSSFILALCQSRNATQREKKNVRSDFESGNKTTRLRI